MLKNARLPVILMSTGLLLSAAVLGGCGGGSTAAGTGGQGIAGGSGSGGSGSGGNTGSGGQGTGGAGTGGAGTGGAPSGSGGASSGGSGAGTGGAATGGAAGGASGGAAGGAGGSAAGGRGGASTGGRGGSTGGGGAGGVSASALATIAPLAPGTITGTAEFVTVANGVQVTINLANCPTGVHGIHIHQGTGCAMADQGNHWGGSGTATNPTRGEGIGMGTGEITCDAQMRGTLVYTRTNTPAGTSWTIGGPAASNVIGHPIVVHSSTMPTDRHACGLIQAN